VDPAAGEHIVMALPQATINQMIWALYSAGTLCLEITTEDIANLGSGTGGGLKLTAGTLSLFLPGLDVVVGKEAPLMISVGVPLDPNRPDVITIGTGEMGADGERDSLLNVVLDNLEIGVFAWVEGSYVRLLAVTTDIEVAFTPLLDPSGAVNIALDNVAITDVGVTYNELFISADLQSLVSFVVELGVGALIGDGVEFPISPNAILAQATGVPLSVEPTSFRQVGNFGDWLSLGVRVGLNELKSRGYPGPRWVDTHADLARETIDAGDAVEAVVVAQEMSGPLEAGTYDVEYRVDGGVWRIADRQKPEIQSALFGLPGRHVVFVRARRLDDQLAVDTTPATLEITVLERPDAPADGVAAPEPSASSSGCSVMPTGQPGPRSWPLVWLSALALLTAVRRRRSLGTLAVVFVVASSSMSCDDDAAPAPQRAACQHDRDCPAAQLCACDGYCFSPRTCSSDQGCCAGEACVVGLCEEVPECTSSADCAEGLSCGGCLCRLPRCISDSDCAGDGECVAGACITPPEFPCPLGCPAGLVCVAELRRCAPVPASCAGMECSPSEMLVVADAKAFIGAACQPAAAACVCEPAAFGVLSGEPTGYLSAVPTLDGGIAVAAYDLATRDVTVRWVDQTGEIGEPLYVDGLPEPALTAPSSERAGLGPGHDIGAELDMAINEGGTLAIASSNRSEGALRLTWSPGGVEWVGVNVDLTDLGARYADIEPIPGGGWTVAYQGLYASGASVRTAFRVLMTETVGPTRPSDAVAGTIAEAVVDGDPRFTPIGTGITPSLARDGERWYATYHDAVAGTLEMATWLSLSNVSVATVLTPETRGAISGGSTGLGAKLWVAGPGQLEAAFIDGTSGELRYARWTYDPATNEVTQLAVELIDLGSADSPRRILATDTAVAHADGMVLLAYQDVTHGDLYVGSSDGAGWAHEMVSGEGAVGFYPQIVLGSGHTATVLHAEWTFPAAGQIEQRVRLFEHQF
jgi:MYXO-CTERM domain-containing protein